MKYFVTILFIFSTFLLNAQSLKPTRFYGDFGMHFGAAMLSKKYSQIEYRGGGMPNGLYASATVSSDRYLVKARGSFFSNSNGNAYLEELSVLIGGCYRKKLFAFDVAVGIGSYALEEAQLSVRYVAYRDKMMGFSYEGNFSFTPVRFFAITPFVFGGVTAKSWNQAFGIKLGFGKYR